MVPDGKGGFRKRRPGDKIYRPPRVPRTAAAARPAVPARAAVPAGPSAEEEQAHQLQMQKMRAENVFLLEKYKDVVKKYNHLVSNFNNESAVCRGIASDYDKLAAQVVEPSLRLYLATKAVDLVKHPGLTGAANKTVTYILPAAHEALQQGRHAADAWFNHTVENVAGTIGDGPVSVFLVYCAVFIPLFIAVYCSITVMCQVRRLLMYSLMYLALLSACAAAFAAYEWKDPFCALAEQDAGLYLFATIIVAAALVLVVCLQCAAFALYRRDGRGITALFKSEVLLSFGMAVVFYFNVWTPAMVDQLPRLQTGWGCFIYVIASAALFYMYWVEDAAMRGAGEDEEGRVPKEKE